MRTLMAVFAAGVLVLLVFAYQSPRVQELFRSSPRARRVPVAAPRPTVKEPEKPAAAIKSATPPESKPVVKRDRPPKRPTQAASAAPTPAKLAKPSVPNDEVTQVLNGVFAARGWQGLALSVTDEIIEVSGEVASEEQRKKVLATLEKARETRRIDAKGLTIAGQ